MRRGYPLLLAGSALACAAAASAAETVGYRYDGRGRLIRVERSGSVNAGVVTRYAYDCADNRTEVRSGPGVPPPPPPPACAPQPPPPPPPPGGGA